MENHWLNYDFGATIVPQTWAQMARGFPLFQIVQKQKWTLSHLEIGHSRTQKV